MLGGLNVKLEDMFNVGDEVSEDPRFTSALQPAMFTASRPFFEFSTST
jgi:hypothetical protein